MTKAPAFVKWFFAIIAFIGGSIVAQLLQPPTAKTEGLGGMTLVAQLEAAPTQANVDTAAVSIVPSSPSDEADVPLPDVDLIHPATIATSETAVTASAVHSAKLPTEPNKEPGAEVDAPATAITHTGKQPTPQKSVTPAASKDLQVARHQDTQPELSPQKPISRSILQSTSGSRSSKKVVASNSMTEENISLTSLPKLSTAASDFQTIRRDLPGQFQPLKGLSRSVEPAELPKVAKNPTAPFSPASVLPTEIVPAAKLAPSVSVIPPKSQNQYAQRSVEPRHPVAKLIAPVESDVARVTPRIATTKDATIVAGNRIPQKIQIQNIAKARTTATQNTKSTVNEKVESQTVSKNSTELNAELTALRSKLKRVIKMYREQEISVREKSAWSVMHSFIGYGVEKQVRIDHQGNRASAIGWVCFNNPCRGVRLFYLKNGEIYGRLGPGNQGHEGQFLAMLAQSRVHADYPMKIEGRDFTVLDLVEREKRSCRPKTELTFKLIGLSHYLDSDETWKDDRGSNWDVPRLIKEEMQQPIIGAACGGTHRLFGLSYAVNRRVHKGQPIDGQYRRAEIYIKDYQKYTFKMQNPDGSFSTRFFSGRGAANDPDRRLLTTGHISEWLAFSLKRDELTDPRMVRAVDYLASLLLRGKYPGWKVGPLGHALHAINIYHDRVFKDAANSPVVASRPR